MQFWHLTFQEYLAAQALAGQRESDRLKALFEDDRIYRPEWREVVLLLAGILLLKHKSRATVDGLVVALSEHSGVVLGRQALAAALLGAIVRDLRPLNFQPSDVRYRALMTAVLGIFEREKAANIGIDLRLEVAEAIGLDGDPRLQQENWVRIKARNLAIMGRSDVAVEAFEIARYPITVADYHFFIEGGAYDTKGYWIAGGFGKWQKPSKWDEQKEHPNWPVTGVSWYEAWAYCRWKNVRLLTELEWKVAACGAGARDYPWGSEYPCSERGSYLACGPHHPTPVGVYPEGSTPEGIQDLFGNVREWTSNGRATVASGSWRESVPLEPRRWASPESALAWQWDYTTDPDPDYRGDDCGFRTARDACVP